MSSFIFSINSNIFVYIFEKYGKSLYSLENVKYKRVTLFSVHLLYFNSSKEKRLLKLCLSSTNQIFSSKCCEP